MACGGGGEGDRSNALAIYYCYQVAAGEAMRWLRIFLHPVYVTGHKPNGCKVTSNPSELRVRPERESTVLAERGTEFCSWERERSRFPLVRYLGGRLPEYIFHTHLKMLQFRVLAISVALCELPDEIYIYITFKINAKRSTLELLNRRYMITRSDTLAMFN